MPQRHRIYLRDATREASFEADRETLLSILAAARDSTGSILELLENARDHYGAIEVFSTAGEADDILDRNAPFKVDLVERTIVFPGNAVDFSPRGLFKGDDGKYHTYVVGRGFTLYDSDRRMFIDPKAAVNNERNLWRDALPELRDGSTLDGIDLGDASLSDIHTWTVGLDDRPPAINGRSIYELHGARGMPPKT